MMKKVFEISVQVGQPVLVGQDEVSGRRQLIPILSGQLSGENINGTVLPGGVDSQVIRPDGVCELSARYAIRLDDGEGLYIENNGIRTVPDAYVDQVKNGAFIDPELYYFRTTPAFEVYSERYRWLTRHVFSCQAKRFPDRVVLEFFQL
ncbi:hypothetical protein VA7868_00387 [Vibrio aerogenes CECT 7868]|uniref:Uncharacterized protein n=1 Tax=Vibrio aerogenes CECT 7868 TaxID=1216006 RepID=A0A1M5VGX8_9VIBR|nr:DUF3237 domain-containing protein [Vibrio aerogenes]SHH74497.1 hypothetical protein VA7868_00387 [Vibrio aerogenes CECT 7868]